MIYTWTYKRFGRVIEIGNHRKYFKIILGEKKLSGLIWSPTEKERKISQIYLQFNSYIEMLFANCQAVSKNVFSERVVLVTFSSV